MWGRVGLVSISVLILRHFQTEVGGKFWVVPWTDLIANERYLNSRSAVFKLQGVCLILCADDTVAEWCYILCRLVLSFCLFQVINFSLFPVVMFLASYITTFTFTMNFFNHLKAEVYLNYIKNTFSSYLAENAVHVH